MQIESGVEVSFSSGFYAPRAWWLIPARTATADIEWPPFQVPNAEPIPQPPFGTAHHFCRIGTIYCEGDGGDAKWQFADCRTQFPSLTHICADDVCYHTRCDALEKTKTVEQALDELCDLSKLRFHKRMLHGWGIVCGLQVSCGGDQAGSNVVVDSGYAIDCEGNDILFQKSTFDVISSLQNPSGGPDGSYSLILDPKVAGKLKLVPYSQQAGTLSAALQGTLLERFYSEYLQPLISYFEKLSVVQVGANVSNQQELISSLINLLAPYDNASTGTRVYVSSAEDSVLHTAYNGFVQLLRDKTFCGFLNAARPWPAYPSSISGIGTVFGMGAKTRIRIDASETQACTVGIDSTIHIYDLTKSELTQVLSLPASMSTAIVQDALFSSDGKTLYVVATLGADSMLATFTVGSAAASATGTISGVTCTSLARIEPAIYTAGVSKGLYQISVSGSTITAKLVSQTFNAIGQLVSDQQTKILYATANTTSSVTNAFNEVLALDTAKQYQIRTPYILPNLTGSPQDDLAVVYIPASPGGAAQQKIYVTTNPVAGGATKQLALNTSTGDGDGHWATADLLENNPIHFAYNPSSKIMFVAYAGSDHIDALRETVSQGITTAVTVQPYAYPAEVSPVSAAWNVKGSNLYVQNSGSNTISVIPFPQTQWTSAQTSVSASPQYAALLQYRDDVIGASLDLAAGVLQYLKDGFCDLFLVNCPSCGEDDPIYLAGITVQNQKVYKVCNFSLRKYVHSFPTVEYWLSAIPVLPLAGWLFRKFCCEVFTEAFAKYEAPQPAENAVNQGFSLSYVATRLKQVQPSAIGASLLAKFSPTKSFVTDYLANWPRPSAAAAAQVDVSKILGQNAAAAQQQLTNAGLTVNLETYDPSKVGTNAYRAATAPSQVPAASSLTLVEDSTGTVRFIVPPSDQVQIVQSQLSAAQKDVSASQLKLQDQVDTLNTQIVNLQATHQVDLQTLNQQIAQLNGSLQTMQTQLQKISNLPPPAKG
jgi:hypothetical protein